MAPPKKTVTRGGGDIESDPEKDSGTAVRASNPLRDRERTRGKPVTRTRRPSDDAAREFDDPDTGQSFHSFDDSGPSSDSALDGDGLDALDPEVGSGTRVLPAPQGDDEHSEESEEEQQQASQEADEANATRAGPPIVLEIVAGPDEGKKRRFKGVRMVIGRTAGIDLQLADQSVSRRHVELIYGDDGVLLRDLGSGNGTKVNGERVPETKLQHGDEIAIGKTKIRFVDEQVAFQQGRQAAQHRKAEAEADLDAADADDSEDESSRERREGDEEQEDHEDQENGAGSEEPEDAEDAEDTRPDEDHGEGAADPDAPAAMERVARRPPIRRRAGAARLGLKERFRQASPRVRLGLVGGAVVFVLLVAFALKPAPPPPVDHRKVNAEKKMEQARAAVREGDYGSAVALIEEAEALSPGIDTTKLGIGAREELKFKEAIDEARRALVDRRFEDARKALAGAQKASPKGEEARDQLTAELETAELAYKKERIEAFIASGEVESARALLAELPVLEQSASAEKIIAFEAELEAQRKREAQEARRNAASAAARRKQMRAEEVAEAFRVVERKFAAGEWDRAASECQRVVDAHPGDADMAQRAKLLQGTIPNFGRNYEEGVRKYKQGAIAQAAKSLRKAYQHYEAVQLRANRYGQELDEMLGAASVAAGREALLRNDLLGAWTSFKDALRIDPQDAKAREGLEQVGERAEDLFGEAYMARDTDAQEALRKFKIVVRVTEPGSTVHEKAKNQVAAMAP